MATFGESRRPRKHHCQERRNEKHPSVIRLPAERPHVLAEHERSFTVFFLYSSSKNKMYFNSRMERFYDSHVGRQKQYMQQFFSSIVPSHRRPAWYENWRFPSCLSPLFQSESQCEAFHMEIYFIYSKFWLIYM